MLELLTKVYELIRRNEERLERLVRAQEASATALRDMADVVRRQGGT